MLIFVLIVLLTFVAGCVEEKLQTPTESPKQPTEQKVTESVESPTKEITEKVELPTEQNNKVVNETEDLEVNISTENVTVITITNFKPDISLLTLNKGDTVKWVTNDKFKTIIAIMNWETKEQLIELKDMVEFSVGGSFEYTFKDAGTFKWYNYVSSKTKGDIIVK